MQDENIRVIGTHKYEHVTISAVELTR